MEMVSGVMANARVLELKHHLRLLQPHRYADHSVSAVEENSMAVDTAELEEPVGMVVLVYIRMAVATTMAQVLVVLDMY